MSFDVNSGVDARRQPCFSLANRTKRAFWNIVQATIFRWSPRPAHAWRVFLLRRFGATIGRECHVYPTARVWAPWNLVMDDQSCLGDDVICYSMATITLGKRAIISQGAHLCAGTHDFEDPNFPLIAKPITIGPEVWVCAEAFIHPGIAIGDGAVIGARAVVTKDMPAWQVCAGHPCKPLKPRVLRR